MRACVGQAFVPPSRGSVQTHFVALAAHGRLFELRQHRAWCERPDWCAARGRAEAGPVTARCCAAPMYIWCGRACTSPDCAPACNTRPDSAWERFDGQDQFAIAATCARVCAECDDFAEIAPNWDCAKHVFNFSGWRDMWGLCDARGTCAAHRAARLRRAPPAGSHRHRHRHRHRRRCHRRWSWSWCRKSLRASRRALLPRRAAAPRRPYSRAAPSGNAAQNFVELGAGFDLRQAILPSLALYTICLFDIGGITCAASLRSRQTRLAPTP